MVVKVWWFPLGESRSGLRGKRKEDCYILGKTFPCVQLYDSIRSTSYYFRVVDVNPPTIPLSLYTFVVTPYSLLFKLHKIPAK